MWVLSGTLDYTKTALGRSLLRTWLLRPSLSLATISARHDAVTCFIDPQNFAVTGTMHTHLNGIKNVPKIFGAVRGGRGKLADWQAIVKVCQLSS
jgi:DNA mismatch repair protein MSH5